MINGKSTQKVLMETYQNIVNEDSENKKISMEEWVEKANKEDDNTYSYIDKKMREANELFGGYGVEGISEPDAYVNKYYYDTIAVYVNMGKTYETTVLYDTENEEFLVTSWGDWYENWQNNVDDETGEDKDYDDYHFDGGTESLDESHEDTNIFFKSPKKITAYEFLKSMKKYDYLKNSTHDFTIYGEFTRNGNTYYLMEKKPGEYGISVWKNKKEYFYDSGTLALKTFVDAKKMFLFYFNRENNLDESHDNFYLKSDDAFLCKHGTWKDDPEKVKYFRTYNAAKKYIKNNRLGNVSIIDAEDSPLTKDVENEVEENDYEEVGINESIKTKYKGFTIKQTNKNEWIITPFHPELGANDYFKSLSSAKEFIDKAGSNFNKKWYVNESDKGYKTHKASKYYVDFEKLDKNEYSFDLTIGDMSFDGTITSNVSRSGIKNDYKSMGEDISWGYMDDEQQEYFDNNWEDMEEIVSKELTKFIVNNRRKGSARI
jgi:hypothetical protein